MAQRAAAAPPPTRPARAGTPWLKLLGALLLGIVLGAVGLLAVAWWFGIDAPALEERSLPANPTTRVMLSEALLTAIVRDAAATSDTQFPLTNARVQSDAGQLRVLGQVELFGQPVPADIRVRPRVSDGLLRMEVTNARLGGLPLPSGFERVVEEPVNRRIRALLGDAPATVTGARVSDEGLVVTAHVDIAGLNGRAPSPGSAGNGADTDAGATR